MKTNAFLIPALFALSFIFNACQESDEIRPRGSAFTINEVEGQQLEGVLHDAIFQFAELDENGEAVSGWIINRAGEIRKYETEITNWDPNSMELGMSQLIAPAYFGAFHGEKIGQVGIAELGENYKKIEATYSDKLEMRIIDQQGPSVAFIGYAADDHTDECPAESYGQQVLISIEGEIQTENHTVAAIEILDWLKTVNEDIYN